MVGLAPTLLAFTFGVHIAMVNLGIGLALLVPYLKWRADRGERALEAPARSLMRFYAATYAVAGVFGTAFTVFLLSYYPGFIGLAGHLTLIPFGLAILLIAVHFFSITSYWYGWGRWSPSTHLAIGVMLAASALLIPLGFRAVFAFLNIPAGLGYDPATGRVYLDVAAALALNPTFHPLYLKSIIAAVTATLIVVAGAFAYRAGSGEGYLEVARLSLKAGLAGLVLMLPLGLWYALSLQHVPYKFNNIFASLGWRVADGKAYFDLSWLFVVKMLLYAVQLAAVAYTLPRLARGDAGAAAKPLVVAGAAALLTIVVGEYLNAFSQYPFFIAVWPTLLQAALQGSLPDLTAYGISIPASALPAVAEKVNEIVLLEDTATANNILEALRLSDHFALGRTVNPIAVDPGVVTLTAVFLGGLLAALAVFFYLVLAPSEEGA